MPSGMPEDGERPSGGPGGGFGGFAVGLVAAVDGDTITDISYAAEGCSISQASTSVMGDLLIGGTTAHALELHDKFLEMMQSQGRIEPDEDTFEDAIAFAGVSKFPARVKCALLGWSALRDATLQATAKED